MVCESGMCVNKSSQSNSKTKSWQSTRNFGAVIFFMSARKITVTTKKVSRTAALCHVAAKFSCGPGVFIASKTIPPSVTSNTDEIIQKRPLNFSCEVCGAEKCFDAAKAASNGRMKTTR